MLNRLWHIGIGAWVGSGVNSKRYWRAAMVIAALFVAYQVVEAWRKGDGGYGEIKEEGER